MATASRADKRQALAALAAQRGGGRGDGASGSFWKRMAVAATVLALLIPVTMWFLGFFSTPREVAEFRRLVDEQVAQLETAALAGTPPDRVAGSQDIRETMRAIPEQYREQAGRDLGRLFAARDRAEMDSYFALPPDQRQTELDRRIKADEDRRKAWESERARRDQQRSEAGGNAATSGGDATAGGRQAAGGGQGGPQPGGNGSGRRGGGTEESRNQWGKRLIDRTTPEQRAQRAEYRRAIEERRIKLGLPPSRRG